MKERHFRRKHIYNKQFSCVINIIIYFNNSLLASPAIWQILTGFTDMCRPGK